MNKADSNDFFIISKIFCYSFSVLFVLSIMVNLIFNPRNINITSILVTALVYSITSSFFTFNDYTKYSTKFIYEDIANKDIIIEVQK